MSNPVELRVVSGAEEARATLGADGFSQRLGHRVAA